MGLFGKSSKDKSTGELGFVGNKMTTNPTPQQQVSNKIARKQKIKLALEQAKLSPEKRAYLEKALRRLDLEIKLEQGDY